MNKNTNIFEKYIKLSEYKGFKNVGELANFLGYSSAEKIYRLNRSGNNKPSYDMIIDISNKFENINLNWLLSDKGEMFNSDGVTTDENYYNPTDSTIKKDDTPTFTSNVVDRSGSKNVKNVHPTTVNFVHPTVHPTRNTDEITVENSEKKLSPTLGKKLSPTLSPTTDFEFSESRISSKELGESVTPTLPKIVTPTVTQTQYLGLPKVIVVGEDGKELIPLISVKAAAGYLNKYADELYIQDLPAMRLQGFKNGTFRAFEVEGHSMLPTIHSGSIAVGEWVENLDHIRDRRIYIIVTNQGVVIKRVLNRIESNGKIIIISDNANKNEYPNESITPDEVKEIWYVRGAIQFTFTEPSEIYTRVNELEGKMSILYDEFQKNRG